MNLKQRAVTLPTNFDRRRKLTDADIKDIQKMKRDGVRAKDIALKYAGKASSGTVHAYINPLYMIEKRRKAREAKPWRKYYDRKKNTIACAKTRAYKQKLFNKGILTVDSTTR
jgi:hypothetical protein